MGSSISYLIMGENCESPPGSRGLGDLPEDCVANIMMHLDPTEICKIARLNRSFSGASSANFVWESKLPSNYRQILGRLSMDDAISKNWSKKNVYSKLCRPNPFDGGTKEVWLERKTGGICLSISSKALDITGIDDRRYWKYIPTEESRFHTVAYLQQIWWLEASGEVDFHFPIGTYSLFFRIQLGRTSRSFGRRICNEEHVHGWGIKPVQFQFSTSNGQHATSQCFLAKTGNWVHYYVGDFVIENSEYSTNVKFSMTQIDCTHTKGGLCLDSVLIYPAKHKEKSVRSIKDT